MTIRIIRTALAGVGAVNRNVLTILTQKAAKLRQRYHLEFRIVLVVDSSGIAYDAQGFAIEALQQWKAAKRPVATLPQAAPPAMLAQFLTPAHCDLLLEATPVNLVTGEPGLTYTTQALAAGVAVVLANKGPLVLAFSTLTALAQQSGAGLAYSATVCGALPVINVGQRDLIAAEISSLRGIFNSTSNFILGEMEQGHAFADALAEAQRRGIAETDPTLDIDGWDTANKLVIIANSVLGVPTTLNDVAVTGIRTVTTAALQAELRQGRTIKLLASALYTETGYRFQVAPTSLAQHEFLGSCHSWEMGIEIQSDLYGTLSQKIWEESPMPTAAALLRDAVNLFRGGPLN